MPGIYFINYPFVYEEFKINYLQLKSCKNAGCAQPFNWEFQ